MLGANQHMCESSTLLGWLLMSCIGIAQKTISWSKADDVLIYAVTRPESVASSIIMRHRSDQSSSVDFDSSRDPHRCIIHFSPEEWKKTEKKRSAIKPSASGNFHWWIWNVTMLRMWINWDGSRVTPWAKNSKRCSFRHQNFELLLDTLSWIAELSRNFSTKLLKL